MGLAFQTFFTLIAIIYATEGQELQNGVSSVKLCLFDFSGGHLSIDCTPKSKQDELTPYERNLLAKRSESSSGQLFNPWVGRRKRNGKDKASTALRIKMDVGDHQEPFLIATDNFWTAFRDKIKQNYYPYMHYYNQDNTDGLTRIIGDDEGSFSNQQRTQRSIKENQLLGVDQIKVSTRDNLKNDFDWDRLKRSV